MAQGQPTPQIPQRPWYYQNWFLVPAFILGWPLFPPLGVLWPVWALLMMRSPWHNNVWLRGLAWAMLVVGAVRFAKGLTADQDTVAIAVSTLIPGLIVTGIVQIMWARYKMELRSGARPVNPPTDLDDFPADPPASSRRSRSRRRVQRKRGSRSGRSPR